MHALAGLVGRYGYAMVALFMIAEGCGIPFPAETMLITAAATASRGTLSIWGVGIAASLGGIVGGSAGYGIGAKGGMRLLHRYGAKVHIDEDKLARSRAFFEKRGLWAAFFGRFVAFLRIVVPMLAGVGDMSFARFSVANAAGAIASAAAFSALGFYFGRDLPKLEHHLTRVSLVIAALLIVWFVVARVRQKRSA
jgi:membrane protein DedA with SNARE-associated domain